MTKPLPQEAELRAILEATEDKNGTLMVHEYFDHTEEWGWTKLEDKIMQLITEYGRKERLDELHKALDNMPLDYWAGSKQQYIDEYFAKRIAALSTPSEQPNRKDTK